jgi:hypothetical protein
MIESSFQPLTPERFADFEQLFGPRGACAGCWCMFWKLRGQAFEKAAGDAAHQMQKFNVESGVVPGLLAYVNGLPAGWIAVEPRSAYIKLAHSRVLAPVDDQHVWSVTCFFIDKQYRGRELTVSLLRAAADYVRAQGGKIVEGYPVDAQKDMPAAFMYTWAATAFVRAGFKEVARNSPTRPIFRYHVEAE